MPSSSSDGASEPGGSLREKVYKGVGWSALATILTQGLNMARSIALARLLTQDEFGLAGLLITVIGALQVLTSLGMGAVVVTRKFEDEDELRRFVNTAWTFEIIRSLLLSILLCALAQPTAHWMGQDRLAPLLLASAPIPFLHAFHNGGLSLLRREMNIGRITQFETLTGIASVVFAISLAWATRSAWGLVVGNFLFSLFFVALSYRFHPYRPRFALDREALRVGFGFGQSVFVGGLMGYISTTADNMIVAKLLGTATLATYMVAFAAATLPMRLVSGLLGQILFPSFAAVGRQGGEQVERITERAFVLGCSLLVVLLTPMFLLSREAMTILYGKPEYIEAAPLLCVMLVGGLFRSLSQILTPLLHGLARPEIDARASVFEAAIFVGLLFAFTFRFGAMGAAWAGVLAYGFSFLVRATMSRSLAPHAFGQLPATLLLALVCAGAGWGAGILVLNSPWLADASVWTRAIVGSLVSLSVLAIELAILFPSLGDEARQFRSLLQRRSGKSST